MDAIDYGALAQVLDALSAVTKDSNTQWLAVSGIILGAIGTILRRLSLAKRNSVPADCPQPEAPPKKVKRTNKKP